MLKFQDMLDSSCLSGANAAYLEAQYEAYQQDPSAVSASMQQYFAALSQGASEQANHSAIRRALIEQTSQPKQLSMPLQPSSVAADTTRLIEIVRRCGHMAAQIDPLGLRDVQSQRLSLAALGMDPAATVDTQGLMSDATASTAALHKHLMALYCHHVGVEFDHVSDDEERAWLYQNFESLFSPAKVMDAASQTDVLTHLVSANALEKVLGEKYPGQKRFSLEGGDTLVPMLKKLVELAAQQAIQVVDIGMAHRGRLNVLVNIMGKPPADLFQEFEGKKDAGMTSGDVKYHLGFSSDVQMGYRSVHLSLACNPSHLEIISPVVLGTTRARQDAADSEQSSVALPVLIHGDAAFSGQGIVMETFVLSQARAYAVGGSIHVVINNQVGFTTSDVRDARSSRYCSDAAKIVEAPVLHVNGDDPEAAVRCMQLAMAYRQRYHKDIVIDLCCYRRHGHQEVDEPTGTQPLMYQVIKKKKPLYQDYAATLLAQKNPDDVDTAALNKQRRESILAGASLVDLAAADPVPVEHAIDWQRFHDQPWTVVADTGCDITQLKAMAQQLVQCPDNLNLQKQVATLMQQRQKMSVGEQDIDWGFAETLAYATLLSDGHGVRLTGQDVRRGTFFHRHAALHDQVTDAVFMPLRQFAKGQTKLSIYDSILSEAAVLGFEYGYSMKAPDDLVIWEAQFGDFVNGAQVVIDQFISSAWEKWERLSGLVMLLPHGYEGQGPEHSSARLERFLQLAAQSNMQVCMPTHAGQIFHLLRRQVLRPHRSPLIVMSPKSLLRHKQAKTSFEELADGHFMPLIPDQRKCNPDAVKRVIFCSGKVYYDIVARCEESERDDVAVLRIEQLYPFPDDCFVKALSNYGDDVTVVWCQEEPKNQGSWYYIRPHIERHLGAKQHLLYAGREAAAAPAVGYPALHAKQQKALVDGALNDNE